MRQAKKRQEKEPGETARDINGNAQWKKRGEKRRRKGFFSSRAKWRTTFVDSFFGSKKSKVLNDLYRMDLTSAAPPALPLPHRKDGW